MGVEAPPLLKPLLGEYDHGVRRGWHPDHCSWKVAHAVGFLTGGLTFTAGTLLLFWPGLLVVPGLSTDLLSALLYILGSLGLCFVDVQEFFTFEGALLRCNIALTGTGSFFFIVGSIGFLPNVQAVTMSVGIGGFVLGAFLIGIAQVWKIARINGWGSGRKIVLSKDVFTATGVELGACLGAWSFFFGTILFGIGPLESVLTTVLLMWTTGSLFFTVGGAFVGFRHFIMGVV